MELNIIIYNIDRQFKMKGLLYMKRYLDNIMFKKIITLLVIFIILYIMICCFFRSHFLIGTSINGIDISCMNIGKASNHIKTTVEDYKLLIEGRGKSSEINLSGLNFKYMDNNELETIVKKQNSFLWITSIFKKKNYVIKDIYSYDEGLLKNKIDNLEFFNEDDIIYPENASLIFINTEFVIVDEVYGNYLDKEKVYTEVVKSIYTGQEILNLDEANCYVNPKYCSYFKEVKEAKNIIDQYMSSKITYVFGDENEVVDYSLINQWIKIDDELNVSIDAQAIMNYITNLAKKYDTVGVAREFKTSTGKTLSVSGGYYGWRINKKKEAQILKEDIENGSILEKEPEYLQKGVCRGENDFGDSYLEINITRQHIWYYKQGKLIAQGDIVSGNVSNGNGTPLGIYEITYKQENSTLRGANYEAKVNYWMPFSGNIGLHDASWRYSYGGDIYLNDGTHGCINAPKYLAKKIFAEIEAGTPVICYDEK